MKLTRFQLYVFGLFLLCLPIIIYKLIWLSKTEKTMGVVLYIDKPISWRSRNNTYPVIEFQAEGMLIRFRGRYNSPHLPGDSLAILYIAGNPRRHRLDTFWSCWIDVFLVNGFILIFWSFLFGRNIITGKRFSITRKGVKVLKEEEEIPYAEVIYPENRKLK